MQWMAVEERMTVSINQSNVMDSDLPELSCRVLESSEKWAGLVGDIHSQGGNITACDMTVSQVSISATSLQAEPQTKKSRKGRQPKRTGTTVGSSTELLLCSLCCEKYSVANSKLFFARKSVGGCIAIVRVFRLQFCTSLSADTVSSRHMQKKWRY